MSKKTISEKIISRAAGKDVVTGDIVIVSVDLALMPDTTPRRIMSDFNELTGELFNPKGVVLVMDHYCPPKDVKEAEIEKLTRKWAKKVGLTNVYEFEGVCHTVVTEKGHVIPGILMVGSDSHTSTAGALGAFAIGLGATDMLGVLVTGETWLNVPETTLILLEGNLPPGVMAKDISLKVLRMMGIGGAEGSVLEYSGEMLSNLCIDERFTLTNMSVETGAATAIIEPDELTFDFLRDKSFTPYEHLFSDQDAKYKEKITLVVDQLEPMVACPDRPDNVVGVNDLGFVKIDQAYIGSCTGGKYHDFEIAAKILDGKKIAHEVRLLLCPASKEILSRIERDGILHRLLNSGATLVTPGCGACAGHRDGILAAGEVCISSTNRNFKGRMGSPEALIYLASPATVAASAVSGHITDPRQWT